MRGGVQSAGHRSKDIEGTTARKSKKQHFNGGARMWGGGGGNWRAAEFDKKDNSSGQKFARGQKPGSVLEKKIDFIFVEGPGPVMGVGREFCRKILLDLSL